MEPKTITANTKDWLEASKGIKIAAYIESYMTTLSMREPPFSSRNLYDAFRKISVPISNQDYQFRQELQAWDALSDEALIIFERELD